MCIKLFIVSLLLAICSCSTSSHLVVDQKEWPDLSKIEVQEFISNLKSQEKLVGSMRHRINVHTDIEKKSFEQSLVMNGELFSLSFYSPAYIKILFRIVEGEDRAVMIDYQNREIYKLDSTSSINLGDEKLPGIGIVYPEILVGRISHKSYESIPESAYKLKRDRDGKHVLLELKQDNFRREYLFDRSSANQYCLREALVELLEDGSSITFKTSESSDVDCIPSKVSVQPAFTRASLEIILLIKQNTMDNSARPFATDVPLGFREITN